MINLHPEQIRLIQSLKSVVSPDIFELYLSNMLNGLNYESNVFENPDKCLLSMVYAGYLEAVNDIIKFTLDKKREENVVIELAPQDCDTTLPNFYNKILEKLGYKDIPDIILNTKGMLVSKKVYKVLKKYYAHHEPNKKFELFWKESGIKASLPGRKYTVELGKECMSYIIDILSDDIFKDKNQYSANSLIKKFAVNPRPVFTIYDLINLFQDDAHRCVFNETLSYRHNDVQIDIYYYMYENHYEDFTGGIKVCLNGHVLYAKTSHNVDAYKTKGYTYGKFKFIEDVKEYILKKYPLTLWEKAEKPVPIISEYLDEWCDEELFLEKLNKKTG